MIPVRSLNVASTQDSYKTTFKPSFNVDVPPGTGGSLELTKNVKEVGRSTEYPSDLPYFFYRYDLFSNILSCSNKK